MNNVFIFGAGASKKSGAPLMNEFIDYFEQLRNSGKLDPTNYDKFIKYYQELRVIHEKSELNRDNIEDLLGAIEMAFKLGKLSVLSKDDIYDFKTIIISFICETLESSIKFPVNQGKTNPVEPYNSLIKLIQENRDPQFYLNKDKFSFITFNYDLALDFALDYYGFGCNYCIDEKSKKDNFQLLKLHGSVNWSHCENCEKINTILFHEVKFFQKTENITFNMSRHLKKKKCCDNFLNGGSFIIPPTWNKTEYHKNIDRIWEQAGNMLSSAENIFIIGYSYPESDMFFKYLYALGSMSTTRIKNFCVINPDISSKVRFERIISSSIKRKFKFIESNFEDSIKEIGSIIFNK